VHQKINEPININDVCVLLIGFNRPDLLRKRIDEIYKSKVRNLQISIDGGHKSSYKKMESLIEYARSKFESLDFFNINYHGTNLGQVRHITMQVSNIFSQFKYVIVIEDDIKISSSFMVNMINGLNIQRDNGYLGIVSGFSPLHFKYFTNMWRKSDYPFLWGWACSIDVWDRYTFDLSSISLESSLAKSKTWNGLNSKQKSNWISRFKKVQADPYRTWDYQMAYISFRFDFLNLAPLYSMVGNEGFNDHRSTNTKSKKPRLVTTKNINNGVINKELKSSTRFFNFMDKFYMNDLD